MTLFMHYLYCSEPVGIDWMDVNTTVDGIDISWSQQSYSSMTDAPETFLLTISHGSNSEAILLNESSYSFATPEREVGAMCEVYKFTVAAASVGTTNIGNSCSVPSPVLSRTLPSLPDVDEVESSLSYLLRKRPGSGTTLSVSFVVSYIRLGKHNIIIV